jgi:branched-chain amino acid transport system permease protein
MERLRKAWWLVLAACIALFPVVMQGKSSAYWSGMLIFAGIYVILAVGLDLLMGYAGQISVGHAAFFAVGAYTSAVLTVKYGFSPLFAMFIGMILSGSLAWALGRPVLALKEYYLAMATLAFNEIVITLIVGFERITGGASGLRDIPPFRLFGLVLDNHVQYYYFVWIVVFLVIASAVAVIRSPFGRTLIAVHSDEVAARAFGVNCASYKTRVFVLANVYASIAGSLFAHYLGFIAPDDFGVLSSVNLLVMLYLGGIGTIYGPALGAVFLKLLPEVTYLFQDYELLLNGIILIVVLLFMPKGLYGIFTAARDRVFLRAGK